MSAQNPTGTGAPPPGILPPNIFDPRLNGTDWYTYVVDGANSPAPAGAGANLAPAGVSNPTLGIDAGTDFYLVALSVQAQANAAGALTESTNLIPLVTVQMNDSGSQRNLFSSALPLMAFAGDGKRPYRLIRPRVFRANSSIAFTFTSLEPAAGTTYSHVFLLLHGYRKFAST